MASPSFAFVPRNVTKSRKQQGALAHVPSSLSFEVTSSAKSEPSYPEPGLPVGRGKLPQLSAKPLYNEKDISILVMLALSDYALWIDPDLRRKTEESMQREECDAGFLPLSYLMHRVFSRENLGYEYMPAEVGVVKAIRTYVGDVLEVRMIVSAPSTSAWYPSWKPERDSVGGYEVRRKDWSMLSDSATRDLIRAQWDDRTVYMENIPPQYHTIPDIIQFTQGLLRRYTPAETPLLFPVQNVTLPPHHLDKPGARPKCKGFALVTLRTTELCHVFLEKWPWKPPFQPPKTGDFIEDSLDAKEALKFGFRTLPKMRWDELNREYLAYRQRLIDELADAREPKDIRTNHNIGDTTGMVLEDTILPLPRNVTTVFSPYPFGCLVFARNLHPETNKTTLRALFTTALESLDTGGLDYIDFNKGMDSCYLRLASPEHARALVDHFSSRLVVQSCGLDDMGKKNPGVSEMAITTEIIEGRKEEVYWEKVPEKIRRQAVDKAVRALSNNRPPPSPLSTQEHSEESRSRKRKKRGQ